MPDWTKRPPLDNESTPPHEDEPRYEPTGPVGMDADFARLISRTDEEIRRAQTAARLDRAATYDMPRPGSARGGIMPGYDITSIGPVQADEIVRDKPLHPGTNMPWTEREQAHTFPRIEIRTVGRQFGKNITTPIESPSEQAARIRRALGLEPRPIVIGLGGYQEHGKDALADILVERHGFMKFGMSDAIHEILMVLDPLIPQVSFPERHMRYSEHVQAVGYTQAKKHPEVRRLLRTLGTEVGRDMIDPDIWVNQAAKKIHAALRNGTSVVLTGVRNGGNELGLMTMLGGTTVWVDRPGHPIPDTTHASENTLGPQDFERRVINDGTLEDLKMAADMLIDGIKDRRAEKGR